jgi:hypothetical protein
MFNWIFAFIHLLLLLAILAYALFSLVQGNILRFALILIFLITYYFLVLHKAVLREVRRKRKG